MKKFTHDHEWIEVDGDIGVVGITDHAQQELSDVVYVDLPEVGKSVQAGDEVATVESVKAAGGVNSPVSGQIIEINEQLINEPHLVNTDAETHWIFKIKLLNPAELDTLMEASAYQDYLNQ